VRVGEALVDPRPVRQAVGVELASRQHDLPQGAVDPVAIVVDRGEVVVGADLLNLRERLEQRLVVPQAHVLQRRRVAFDVLAAERRIARNRAFLDAVERERPPRRFDVVLDVGRLARLLVRRDDEPLQHRAVDLAAERDDEIQPDRDRDRPVAAGERLQHRQPGADQADEDQDQRRRHAAVDVGIAGTAERAAARHEEFGALQPGAERQHQQEGRRQQREVPARRAGERERGGKRRREAAAGHEVDGAGADRRQRDQALQQPADQLQERQREHVERHVAAQERVGLGERHGVAPRHPDVPLARREQRDEDRDQHRRRRDEGLQLTPARQRDLDALTGNEDGPQVAHRGEGDAQVQHEPDERDHERDGEERPLAPQHRLEHRLVAHFAEPEPVGVEPQQGRGGEHQDEDGEEPDVARGAWRHRSPGSEKLKPRSKK
jgi:hypothetical protein